MLFVAQFANNNCWRPAAYAGIAISNPQSIGSIVAGPPALGGANSFIVTSSTAAVDDDDGDIIWCSLEIPSDEIPETSLPASERRSWVTSGFVRAVESEWNDFVCCGICGTCGTWSIGCWYSDGGCGAGLEPGNPDMENPDHALCWAGMHCCCCCCCCRAAINCA